MLTGGGFSYGSEMRVKLVSGLNGGWVVEFIQGGSSDGVVDEASCWLMVVILLVKDCRKVVQV